MSSISWKVFFTSSGRSVRLIASSVASIKGARKRRVVLRAAMSGKSPSSSLVIKRLRDASATRRSQFPFSLVNTVGDTSSVILATPSSMASRVKTRLTFSATVSGVKAVAVVPKNLKHDAVLDIRVVLDAVNGRSKIGCLRVGLRAGLLMPFEDMKMIECGPALADMLLLVGLDALLTLDSKTILSRLLMTGHSAFVTQFRPAIFTGVRHVCQEV